MTPHQPTNDTSPSQPQARTPRSPWYQHWKDIADMTMNILPHEPRVKMIATMLDRCDMAYQEKDVVGFIRLKKQLRNLINASNPRPPKPAS